ncbi:PKD domain-containing protein [Actinoplanes derwentensis]|uniref:PKD domain-containing protein n=1 Tax=Actinoplanes derwentensis TaxID=113562 RepID=A0A1H2D0K9_9ACTN|nr:hypothetical protein [Actinoplanes derwentensis]GID85850.1 hypothetical protein Ade03nite_47740 [Actinoplanes derwentensis]SDT76261.1 hypothetical protein SAMN04489716_7565 [Actinoplanes derwentensis]
MKPRLAALMAAALSGVVVAAGVVSTTPAAAVSTHMNLRADESGEPSDSAEPSESGDTSTAPDPEQTEPSASPSSSAPSPEPSNGPSSGSPGSSSGSPSAVPGDVTPPTGTFRLNATGLWLGQQVRFEQRAGEFSTDTVSRVINWGDGSTTPLPAGTTAATKQYGRVGSYPVTVVLTDRAGNRSSITAKTVRVTTPAGKWALSRTKVYQGVPFSVNVPAVPSGATRILIDWSNGKTVQYTARKGAFTNDILYKPGTSTRISGTQTVRISFGNANGWSAYQGVGRINVLADRTRPSLTITKPSAPSRIASWKTVRGTVADKGSGAPYVWLTVARSTSAGRFYCLTPARKWKRYTTDAQFWDYCAKDGVRVTASKGKWSMKVPAGATKGQFLVYAWTYDWADNLTQKSRQAALTRS